MEVKKSSSTRWFLATLLCLAALGIAAVADDSIAEKCSSEFTKVTQCLPFVSSKAAVPSKECCDSVTDLKDTNPACICYIIQQIHNGSNAAVKSMGVQESRLLQLQSACKLANASVSECPKLLHLPPNSPDAAIFTNTNTSTATTTTPVATPSTSTSTTGSNGYWDKPQLAGYVIVALAIFFHAFPTGTSSPIAL